MRYVKLRWCNKSIKKLSLQQNFDIIEKEKIIIKNIEHFKGFLSFGHISLSYFLSLFLK